MRIRQSLSVLYVALVTLLMLQTGTVLAGQEIAKPAETSHVCMVNDAIMAKPQIPVVVDGKTYYGCCAMCAEGLKSDASLRAAKDPVTGSAVDKAKAVIGMGPKGEALYFESLETFNTYFKQTK